MACSQMSPSRHILSSLTLTLGCCTAPMDDGHLGYEYVPSGGYCDPDVFMGAIWYQRIKQFLLAKK